MKTGPGIAVVVQGFYQYNLAAKVSGRAFGDELGQGSGAVVLWAVGRLGQGTGILAHGVARDPELAGYLPQGEALEPGVLHRFPDRQRPRGQLAVRRKGSFSTATGRMDSIIVGDLVVDQRGLQVGQLSQLVLAETMVTRAFHDSVEFRSGSHGPVRGSQDTGSRRRLPTGDDFVLIAYLEATFGVFQDFDMHPGIAGTLGAGKQLQGAPLLLDRVVTGHLSGVFEAEYFGQDPRGIPGAVGRLRQFGCDRELAVVARQEVPEEGVGLVYGSGASQA